MVSHKVQCLGPILFLIYNKDLPSSSSVLQFLMFADDTNIFLKHKDVNQAKFIMNNELAKVQDWFTANKLVLNVSKTHYMTFGNNTDDSEADLFINNMKIEQDKTVNFLGVFIDEEMKRKSHVNNILSKVSKNIGIMNIKAQRVYSRTHFNATISYIGAPTFELLYNTLGKGAISIF